MGCINPSLARTQFIPECSPWSQHLTMFMFGNFCCLLEIPSLFDNLSGVGQLHQERDDSHQYDASKPLSERKLPTHQLPENQAQLHDEIGGGEHEGERGY